MIRGMGPVVVVVVVVLIFFIVMKIVYVSLF
jgi:hypothetical protein